MNNTAKILVVFILFVFTASCAHAKVVINDFLVDLIDKNNIEQPYIHTKYDYTGTKKIPIELQITKQISTKDKNLYENEKLAFLVKYDVVSNGKIILKRNDTVEAEITNIIKSGINGTPYTIVIDNFENPNLNNDKMIARYLKSGHNRAWLVYPLKWALTFLPPTGSLTNFIKGGHAKITPKDKITIYYYPDWK